MNVEDYIEKQAYPGRFIIIGKSKGSIYGVYGATGRSPASLERRYINTEGLNVHAVPTSSAVQEQGNPDLLTYKAVSTTPDAILLTNGRQGQLVKGMRVGTLATELSFEEPEPDNYNTPRITGLIEQRNSAFVSALNIIRKKVDGTTSRDTFYLPLEEGKGYYIATYDGKDERPAKSFSGVPVLVEINFEDTTQAAHSVFKSLAPKKNKQDYRVGVVAAKYEYPNVKTLSIVNKQML